MTYICFVATCYYDISTTINKMPHTKIIFYIKKYKYTYVYVCCMLHMSHFINVCLPYDNRLQQQLLVTYVYNRYNKKYEEYCSL